MARAALGRSDDEPPVRVLKIRVDLAKNVSRRGLSAMALDAPAHRERRVLIDPIHSLHRPVTGLAGDAFSDVALVREVDVIGKLVHANPLNGFAFDISLADFLNPRTIRLHDAMAVHADVQRGNRRMPRALHVCVAVHAGDVIHASMKFVAKRDRLLRRITLIGS